MQAFDFGERGLEAVPLRLELLAAAGHGDGVFKNGVIGPQFELLEGGATGEEVENAADEGLLLAVEFDSGCGVDVCVLDLEVGCSYRHY